MALKVILVDDEPSSASATARLLGHLGCEVSVCTDATSAVEVALAEDVDLVCLDIQMPGLDGFEVLSLIRSHEHTRRTASVPVMAITGKVAPEQRAEALGAGFAAQVDKPVRLDALQRSLRLVSMLRGELTRTRYAADADAVIARLDSSLQGSDQSRLQSAAVLAMLVEQQGRTLLTRALQDAYTGNDAHAASHVDVLVALSDAIGAAKLAAHCRSFGRALPGGRTAFEVEAVLLRAELDRVIYTLREQVLPARP